MMALLFVKMMSEKSNMQEALSSLIVEKERFGVVVGMVVTALDERQGMVTTRNYTMPSSHYSLSLSVFLPDVCRAYRCRIVWDPKPYADMGAIS
jgi:hypothetical protein